jgi:hypothetical protein
MPLILALVTGCGAPCDCDSGTVVPTSDSAPSSTSGPRPPGPVWWAEHLCETTNDTVRFQPLFAERQDDDVWLEIWRDEEGLPYEVHDATAISFFLDLQLKPVSPVVSTEFEPGVSTYYACDSSGDAAHDPTLWGDGTVFVHARNGADHVCFVGGKHHELGRAMGCTSLHTGD